MSLGRTLANPGVGTGLRGPCGIARALLLHAEPFGNLVSLPGEIVENVLCVLSRPQAAKALPEYFFVLVGLDER